MPLSLRLPFAVLHVLRFVPAGGQARLPSVTDLKHADSKKKEKKKRKKAASTEGEKQSVGRDVIYLLFITLTPGVNVAPQRAVTTHHVTTPPPAASAEEQHIKRIPRRRQTTA